MTTLLMILGACMVGLGIGLMNPEKQKSTPSKTKKYDWSLKGFLKNPPRDIAHSPSKRYRRR